VLRYDLQCYIGGQNTPSVPFDKCQALLFFAQCHNMISKCYIGGKNIPSVPFDKCQVLHIFTQCYNMVPSVTFEESQVLHFFCTSGVGRVADPDDTFFSINDVEARVDPILSAIRRPLHALAHFPVPSVRACWLRPDDGRRQLYTLFCVS
jgi:hypothetical protein